MYVRPRPAVSQGDFDGHKARLGDQSLKEGEHIGPLTIVATPGQPIAEDDSKS